MEEAKTAPGKKSPESAARSHMAIGEWLKNERSRRRMTQTELGAKLGRNQRYVSRLESGQQKMDLVEFAVICRALNKEPVETFRQLQRSWGDGG